VERAEERIKDELAQQIEAMNKEKKSVSKEEWLAIEDAILTLLRATRFILDKLDNIEKTIKGKG
jgi:molybdopterin/thiamine biosynthesis adenylyltransferase